MSEGNFVAVIDFDKNQLSLFDDEFKFKNSDTVIFVNEMIDNDTLDIYGRLVPMIQVFNFDGDDLYTREQFEKLGIDREFESFDVSQVTRRYSKSTFPWITKKTQEVCRVPTDTYAGAHKKRKSVKVSIPKESFTIFDFRKDADDK